MDCMTPSANAAAVEEAADFPETADTTTAQTDADAEFSLRATAVRTAVSDTPRFDNRARSLSRA